MGHDLMLNQMELRYFTYQEFSLPLFSEVPMPNLAKWLLQINSQICLEMTAMIIPLNNPGHASLTFFGPTFHMTLGL
jgi:hypothetical protein